MPVRSHLRSRELHGLLLLLAAGAAGSCGGGDGGDISGPPDPPVPAAVASVELTPASLDLLVGHASRLTATARAADGRALTGKVIAWASAGPAMATVDETGMVTAVAAGRVEISATSEGKAGTATVTVTARTGTVRTWKGGASGKPADWSTAANWDPRGAPIPLDTVRVPAVANPAVLGEDVQIARLIVAGGVVRTAGHRLTVKVPE